MKQLALRASEDLLRHVDEFQRVRGLSDRSEAVRVAIREAVMEPEERQTVPDRDELLRLLGESARNGSVTAMKVLLEEHRRDGGDDAAGTAPRSVIDELAARRSA